MSDVGVRPDGDWYAGSMPANAEIAPGSFVASSYAFTGFASQCRVGLRMGVGAGIYEQCALLVGPRGQVDVGD